MPAIQKNIRLFFIKALRCAEHSGKGRPQRPLTIRLFLIVLLVISLIPCRAAAIDTPAQLSGQNQTPPVQEASSALTTGEAQPAAVVPPKRANFDGEYKSREVQQLADWVVDSGDNDDMPFAIVDKIDAKVFVFNANGQLRGASPVLLGLAKGDDSVPGIGEKKLSAIRPEDRTTPAGRFVAYIGRNFHGKDILWVDYKTAVSLHRVVTNNPKERRLERLATPTPLDNRISFGCINVPAKFYDSVVNPSFAGTRGIVYVLPETRSINEIFATYYSVE